MDDLGTDDLRNDAKVWLERALEDLECESTDQLSANKCKQPLKDGLALLLFDALQFVSRQNDH